MGLTRTLVCILCTAVFSMSLALFVRANDASPGRAAAAVATAPPATAAVATTPPATEDATDLSAAVQLPHAYLIDEHTLVTKGQVTDPELLAHIEQANRPTDQSVWRFIDGSQLTIAPGIDPAWRASLLAAGDDTPVYSSIQFKLPLDRDAYVDLEAQGITFYGLVVENGVYARVPASALPHLERWLAAGSLRAVLEIPQVARMLPRLVEEARSAPTGALEVRVFFFDPLTPEQQAQVTALMQVGTDDSAQPYSPAIFGAANADALLQLAQLPFVRHISRETGALPANAGPGVLPAHEPSPHPPVAPGPGAP